VVNAAVLRATPHARRDADGRLGPALAILWTPRRRALPSNSHDRGLAACCDASAGWPAGRSACGQSRLLRPTTGDLTAVYWNPAAWASPGQSVHVRASRARPRSPVNRPRSSHRRGCRAGTSGFPSASGRASSSPWLPPGPRGFLGGAAGARFALPSPPTRHFLRKLSFNVATPTRYHLVSVGLSTTRPGFRASHRTPRIRCKSVFAPGLLFSYGHLVFDEDTALVARRWRIQRGGPLRPSDGRNSAPSYFVVGASTFAGPPGKWPAYSSAPWAATDRQAWP